MIRSPRLLVGWVYVKRYLAAVIAAYLMYGGIQLIISAVKYHFTNLIVQVINAVIRGRFPDYLLLSEYRPTPWRLEAGFVAIGVMVIVVGLLVGLWVSARKGRQLAQ